MQVREIYKKLQRGDKARIARIVGCANGTVNAVLMGWRNPDTALSKRIIDASQELIRGTNDLEVKLSERFGKVSDEATEKTQDL